MAQALRNPRPRGHLIHNRTGADTHHGFHPGSFRGRQHVAAIVVVGLLALVTFRLFPVSEVLVVNDGRAVHVRTTFDTPSDALDAAKVDLGPGDRVVVAKGEKQSSVAVHRARAVEIEVDGTSMVLETHASTVAGALAAAGVEVLDGDQVFVDGKLTTSRGPLNSGPDTLVSLSSGRVAGASAPQIEIVRARPVHVSIDGSLIETRTTGSTVDEVLEGLGILVREVDLVSPALNTVVSDGLVIEVAQASSVSVLLNGNSRTMYTLATSVGELLAVLGIEPGPGDIISPAVSTPLEEGLVVTIGLTQVLTEHLEESIPSPVVYESDPSLPTGKVRVVEGMPGLRSVGYEATYRNGELVSRTAIPGDVTVVREATPTRHISGTARRSQPTAVQPASPPAATSPVSDAAFSGTYRDKVTAFTTWYNASHGGKTRDDPWYGYTATGAWLEKGICATDPAYIPMGTLMYIPGYGTCLAADVGGGVRGWHVDLGFPESAVNPWGANYVDIYIIE